MKERKTVELVIDVSGYGFHQVDPKHGLLKGRVFNVIDIVNDRPRILTDAGEEMWLKLREFKWCD